MLDGDNWLTDVTEAAQEELRSKVSVLLILPVMAYPSKEYSQEQQTAPIAARFPHCKAKGPLLSICHG